MNQQTVLFRIRFNNNYLLFYLALVLIGLVSCERWDAKRTQSIGYKLTNKTVLFPIDMPFTIRGKDTIFPDILQRSYKVLCYIDLTKEELVSQLNEKWMHLAQEMDSLAPQSVGFVFWTDCNSVSLDNQSSKKFDLPIFCDQDNLFSKLNDFPKKSKFRCFLLNADNQILLVGNPVDNNGLWNQYKGYILHQDSVIQSNQTSVAFVSNVLDLGRITVKNQVMGLLSLKNTGNRPLVIQKITTSCGCTEVDFEESPILMNKSSTIKIVYKADVSGAFQKNLLMYCNVKESPISLYVKGIAE